MTHLRGDNSVCPFYLNGFIILTRSQQLLLRWIDDYLYVTTSLENALSFLDMMNEGANIALIGIRRNANRFEPGHPDYGCFVSKEKTLTNFRCAKNQPNMLAPNASGTLTQNRRCSPPDFINVWRRLPLVWPPGRREGPSR